MSKSKEEKTVEPVVEEAVAEEPAKVETKDNTEAFIARKLKAINKMQNPAKAERLANRLLSKRR